MKDNARIAAIAVTATLIGFATGRYTAPRPTPAELAEMNEMAFQLHAEAALRAEHRKFVDDNYDCSHQAQLPDLAILMKKFKLKLTIEEKFSVCMTAKGHNMDYIKVVTDDGPPYGR